MQWIDTIHHDGSPNYVIAPERQIGAQVTLRLRLDVAAPVSKVFVRTCPDGEQAMVAMEPAEASPVAQWWQASLSLSMLRTGYRFLLHSDAGSWWYSAAGATRHNPTDATDFKLLAEHHAPEWLTDTVFYQIFPDRFADGDPSNNVRDGEYEYHGRQVVARTWGELPDPKQGSSEFFGGDLDGIAERLDYLADLGINGLYLNPIFTAPSSHKYDVADYFHVDPHFGGDAALARLRTALDRHTMRLMLDIVPNHCGATHPWFTEAQADPNAPSADFFTFRKHPDEYESWLGVASLPKLNYLSAGLREVMYESDGSVMRHWLREPFRIDGWRIDVANMLGKQGPHQLGHKIGRAIRRAVKREAPSAYILGEHFQDGTPHLQGDELDASMNYQGFMFPVWGWLSEFRIGAEWGAAWSDRHPLPTSSLADQWRAFRSSIPWEIAMQQFNLLNSHDTPRLRSLIGSNDAVQKLATILLFTYPGVPCLYYGDEIGLEGLSDPDCRRCMIWDETQWHHDLYAFHKLLIGLRRTSPALRWGGFQQLYAANETIAYLREAPEERLIVVARRSADDLRELPVRHAGIADGTRAIEVFSGNEASISAGNLPLSSLADTGAQIWRLV